MLMFRLKEKCGGHQEGSGDSIKNYKAGEIVESERPLDITFPNKFERIQMIQPVVVPTAVEGPVVVENAPSKRPVGRPPKDEDVSRLFPAAEDKDVKIIRRGRLYIAQDLDNPSVIRGNFDSSEAVSEWLAGRA